MGTCLSICNSKEDGVDGCRQPARRKSRTGASTHGRSERIASICGRPPPPDFGVSSVFQVMELLGEGGTGQTYLCQDLRSARRVAIKFMPRPLAKVLVPMVSQEIQLQAQLSEGHLGLVRVESALLSRTHLGLVMEYVDGGTLTQYVMKRAANRGERGGLHLVEDEARYFFRQLIAAVEYLHTSHVAHRDLKMCNVVLTQQRPPALKLCDFGFAKGWDDSSVMNTRIGTPVYMSPQLIASKNEGKAYSATRADVWACGVMLYAMLLGRFPYDHVAHPDPNSSGAHLEVWSEQMKAMDGDWSKSPRVAPHIILLSEECKDLLGKMLCSDESQRITIPEIRKHPWYTTILPPYLDAAWKEIDGKQARIAKVMEGASEAQLKRRNKAVHDLIVMAGNPASAPIDKRLANTRACGISAIFEGTVEGDSASVSSAIPPTLSRTSGAAAAPAGSDEAENAAAAGAAAAGEGAETKKARAVEEGRAKESKETGEAVVQVQEVIMIELAAVARRTKSDGLMLMSSYGRDVEAEAGGQCDSDETDPGPDGSSTNGADPHGRGSPPHPSARTVGSPPPPGDGGKKAATAVAVEVTTSQAQTRAGETAKECEGEKKLASQVAAGQGVVGAATVAAGGGCASEIESCGDSVAASAAVAATAAATACSGGGAGGQVARAGPVVHSTPFAQLSREALDVGTDGGDGATGAPAVGDGDGVQGGGAEVSSGAGDAGGKADAVAEGAIYPVGGEEGAVAAATAAGVAAVGAVSP